MPDRSTRPGVLKRGSAAIVLAVVLVSLASSVHAQDGPFARAQQLRAACAADYDKYCFGVRPGRGRIIACLNANAEKLSQECFNVLAQRGLAMASVMRLCREDYDRLCSAAPRGVAWGIACLVEKRSQVSPACQNVLQAHGVGSDPEDDAAPGQADPPPEAPPKR